MGGWGLTLRVNPLFLLILFLFFLVGMIKEALIAFSLVILHEFIHVIVAQISGYRVYKVELFPFGGMAEYSGLLEMEPWQEIKVALAGPFFNLLLAFIVYFISESNISGLHNYLDHKYFNLVIQYNLVIASINLIPALPLDGGRAFRAVLVYLIGIKKGNKLALCVAKYIAYSGIVIGFIILIFNQANIWFLFFFFFVYGIINREEKQLFYYFLRYLSKRREIIGDIRMKKLSGKIITTKLPVKEAIYYINPGRYNLYFVLDLEYNLAGIITETKMLTAYFSQKDKQISVGDLI